MPNLETAFIGGAYTARSRNLNSQVCQNLYMEVDQTGAKSPVSLVGCPGALEWLDVGFSGEVRGFQTYTSNLYVVIANKVYSIDSSKTYTEIGTINTSTGWVDITDDGIYLTVYDSTGGWTWDGTTFASIADADLPTPSGATYQDGYQIVSRANTDQFFISAQDDPTSWDATDFATAEGGGDILISPVSVQRQLWLIGRKTTEIWYNSGETFPFTRNPGGFIAIGCNSKRSIATLHDELFFLDDKNRVVRRQGLQLVPVSTYQIDYLISTMTTTSNSVGFLYSQEGHIFYELSFPTDDKTICYDLTTTFWHTRATGAADHRSRANCSVRFNDLPLVGDFENGKIYSYDLTTYTDNGDVKRAIRTCQFISNNAQITFFNSFTLDMEVGVGTILITDPQIMLEWSDDGGHTWSNEHWRSIGAVGEYASRVIWRRLGKSRNRVFRVTITDAVKRNLLKAYLDGTNTDV